MKRVLACYLFVATSLVGCAATDDIDPSEEDAIADAAGTGKADAPSFPLGIFNAWQIDYESNEPLHAAFHEDGSMDFTKFVDDTDTIYSIGTFKAYKYAGRDRLRLTDQSGRVVYRGDWSLDDDGDLVLGEETLLESAPDADRIVTCVAMKVEDTSMFEEGFTEYEYPNFSIAKSGASYLLDIGAAYIEPTEATITLETNTRELLVNASLSYDRRLQIKIPNTAPRRGTVSYAEEPGAPLSQMASLLCH